MQLTTRLPPRTYLLIPAWTTPDVLLYIQVVQFVILGLDFVYPVAQRSFVILRLERIRRTWNQALEVITLPRRYFFAGLRTRFNGWDLSYLQSSRSTSPVTVLQLISCALPENSTNRVYASIHFFNKLAWNVSFMTTTIRSRPYTISFSV